jgi:serine/threonine-protein kinase RsbW
MAGSFQEGDEWMRTDYRSEKHDQVELRVPADGRFVAALRSLATALGAQCDLTVDEIEDLQIAVDESCALLLPHVQHRGEWLTARFTLAPRTVDFVASVPAAAAAPDRTGFPWAVLSAVAERLEVTSTDGQLAIGFTVRREALAQ